MKKIIYTVLATVVLTSCVIKLTDNKKASLKNELQEMVKADQIAAFHWEDE